MPDPNATPTPVAPATPAPSAQAAAPAAPAASSSSSTAATTKPTMSATEPLPTKVRPDFVMVQLTAVGQKLAGNHPMTVCSGRRHFVFTGATSVEVEKSFEWNVCLKNRTNASGLPLFQIVPSTTAS
jgi:hypothetical protein